MIRLILVAMILSIHTQAAGEDQPVRSLTMTPGDSMTITYPAGSDVKVSRKGVVDVFPVSDTKWQLTALRGGLVIIDAIDPSGQPQLPRLFIDVKGPSSEGRPPVAVGLPDWICKEKGMSCAGDSGVVEGTVRDFRWFLRAASWCNTTRNCTIFAVLSENARSALSGYIGAGIPDYPVTVTETGRITATAPCDAITPDQHVRTIDASLPRLIEDKILTFHCAADQAAYRVTIKARKLSGSEGEVTGYEGKAQHQVSAPPSFSRWSASSQLKAEAVHATQETLGAPGFLATGGTEFQALIGGELPYITESQGHTETYRWKEYGLSIKGTIRGKASDSTGRKLIRGSFEVFLKSINEQSAGGLLSSNLKTNASFPGGEWSLLGELDLSTDMQRSRFVPGLASVPIIGPLFRQKGVSASRSRLQIWALIEPQ